MNDVFLRLISDNEQDLAAGREWAMNTADEDLLRVWMRCQVVHDDPVDEAVTRLAQLKLAEFIEEKYVTRPSA